MNRELTNDDYIHCWVQNGVIDAATAVSFTLGKITFEEVLLIMKEKLK